ncbi:MAG: hypothetical protein KDC88_14395 [Ignavibacteriae bacterium]|nr:hypothetical protein [Ignavibacteriota bacterium]
MKDQFDSICPIFFQHKDFGKTIQIGSGILFKIGNYSFLLTVSHIIDFLEKGDLLVPCKDRIDSIEGAYSFLAIKKGLTRNDDREEMTYFKLTDEFANRLHDDFVFLEPEDIIINDVFDFNFYTFSGYPYRKSRSKNHKISTEMFNYTGFIVSAELYSALNYDPKIHIVVKYRRTMSVNPKGERITPPLPHGISGGGVFAWPNDYKNSLIPENRQIIGVGHTYLEKEDLFIGTKIIAFVQAIGINNPELVK